MTVVITTVRELMEALEAAVAEHGPLARTAPVRLALDPDDPAEHVIDEMHVSTQPDVEDGLSDRRVLMVHLVQGEHLRRLPHAFCRDMGWQE